MKKFALIEFLISLALAIASLVLSIIYRNNVIVAIVTAFVAISTIINVSNIFRDVTNKSSLEERIDLLGLKVDMTKKYVHIDSLEKIERDFCHSSKDARVYVISNDLTNDNKQFLDEIKCNLKKGVVYYYVVSSEQLSKAEKIKEDAMKGGKNLNGRFNIEHTDFALCPTKYTIVIYFDEGSPCLSDGLKGYCCAQDSTDDGIYFRELTHKNTEEIKKAVDDLFDSKVKERLVI